MGPGPALRAGCISGSRSSTEHPLLKFNFLETRGKRCPSLAQNVRVLGDCRRNFLGLDTTNSFSDSGLL